MSVTYAVVMVTLIVPMMMFLGPLIGDDVAAYHRRASNDIQQSIEMCRVNGNGECTEDAHPAHHCPPTVGVAVKEFPLCDANGDQRRHD